MTKNRYQKAIDKNETSIKNELLQRGYHVEDKYDDLLIFDRIFSKMWQLEVKTHNPVQANGKIQSGYIKDKQYKQLCKANNCYFIGWDIENIIKYITKPDKIMFSDGIINPFYFSKRFKEWLTVKELKRLRESKDTRKWFNL